MVADVKRVLFVCTHNSARSQMAEGLLRHLRGDRYEASSAGTTPGSVRPLAIEAMAELDIDISGQRAKSVDGFLNERFDYVVTVCDQARESCPVFPNAGQQLHWSLPDPSEAKGNEGERLRAFRAVRDELRQHIEATFGEDADG